LLFKQRIELFIGVIMAGRIQIDFALAAHLALRFWRAADQSQRRDCQQHVLVFENGSHHRALVSHLRMIRKRSWQGGASKARAAGTARFFTVLNPMVD
jgi:hypothetical protein